MRNFLATKSVNSGRTARTYMYYLSSYFRWKGSTAITKESYSNFILHLREKNRKQNGIATCATVLREYARFLGKKVDDWPVPRTQKVVTRYLRPDEIQRIRDAIMGMRNAWRNIFIFDFLLGTGMRVSELLNLRWGDVDVEEGLCHITQAKGNKARTVRLSATALRAFSTYARTVFGEGVTPAEIKGNPGRVLDVTTRQDIEWMLARAAHIAGLDALALHPHLLRHTFAVYMAKNRIMTERELQLHLGHSSLQTTERYMQFSNLEGAEIKDVEVGA